jgi:hypothetical protein
MRITCPQCEGLSREEQERCKHIIIDPSKFPVKKFLYNVAPAITRFGKQRHPKYVNKPRSRRSGV